MYLVDTNVISAGAPTKARVAADLVRWMDQHSLELYVSVVTITEIEDGIAKARRERPKRKASQLTAWLETLLHLYADRVLPSTLRRLALLVLCRTSRAARALRPDSPISCLRQRPAPAT
jgi:toxin FitB